MSGTGASVKSAKSGKSNNSQWSNMNGNRQNNLNQTGGNLLPIRDQQTSSIASNIIQKRGGSNATENKLISNRGHSGTNRNANNSNVVPSLTS